jgi:hypothetical protein
MNKDFNEIDKLAKDAFENYEVDFNPEDWNKMEQKLNKKEHLMPYIWLYKGTEAFIFLLIIFTAFNFFNAFNEKGDESKTNNLQHVINAKDSGKDRLLSSNEQHKTVKTESNSGEKTEINNAELNNATKEEKNNNQFNGITNTSSQIIFSSDSRFTKAENISKNLLNEVPFNNFTDGIISNNNSTEVENNAVNSFLAENKATTKENKSEYQIIKIDLINLSKKHLNPGDGVEEGKGFGIKSNFKFPKLYRRQMRAAIYAGADINFNNVLGQGKIGFSLTALIEQEISDRFAIRSGLQISHKSFENIYTKEYVNPLDENSVISSEITRNTTLAMVSMPIHLNTVLYRDEKWRISLSTGIAAGMLTNRFVNGTQRSSIAQGAGSITNISEINGNAYRNGALQGGNAAQNFFMAASLGADIERQLGDRVTLFVQPMFSHNINRLGADKERYGQISLNAGIKAVIR